MGYGLCSGCKTLCRFEVMFKRFCSRGAAISNKSFIKLPRQSLTMLYCIPGTWQRLRKNCLWDIRIYSQLLRVRYYVALLGRQASWTHEIMPARSKATTIYLALGSPGESIVFSEAEPRDSPLKPLWDPRIPRPT